MLYLVHSDFTGTPVGVWNAEEENYYPEDTPLKKSATTLMESRIEGEPWEEFADRLSDRVSHRDWWETHETSALSLVDVWHELVPSSESL